MPELQQRTGWLAAQRREGDRLRQQLGQMRGVLPLLMKRRNGGEWSRAERDELLRQLRTLVHLSPYLVVLVLPGSFIVLPLLAWWLDRRRRQRLPTIH